MKKFIAIILLFVSVDSFAQADSSGKWVINKSKTQFGQAPEWGLPKDITVEQQKAKFVFNRNWLNEAGASHVSRTSHHLRAGK